MQLGLREEGDLPPFPKMDRFPRSFLQDLIVACKQELKHPHNRDKEYWKDTSARQRALQKQLKWLELGANRPRKTSKKKTPEKRSTKKTRSVKKK
jgi:hypothetical protein